MIYCKAQHDCRLHRDDRGVGLALTSAFSLIELVLVLTIIAIVAAVMILAGVAWLEGRWFY